MVNGRWAFKLWFHSTGLYSESISGTMQFFLAAITHNKFMLNHTRTHAQKKIGSNLSFSILSKDSLTCSWWLICSTSCTIILKQYERTLHSNISTYDMLCLICLPDLVSFHHYLVWPFLVCWHVVLHSMKAMNSIKKSTHLKKLINET